MAEVCKHLKQVEQTRERAIPSSAGCLECLQTGQPWVHLRLCLGCGHVGCCDSSPNKHATRHYHASHHPVVKSYEPGESWAWCYADQQMVDEISAFPEEVAPHHFSPPGLHA